MVILKPDATESTILDQDYAGSYQISCDVFVQAVKMQFSDDNGATYVDAYFNGNLIQLDRAGAILDMDFTRGRYYKFVTGAIGTRVSMFRHAEHGQ